MKKLILICFFLQHVAMLDAQNIYTVPDKIKPDAVFFPLTDVRLTESPFKNAMDKDGVYLLSLEPDRFLHRFRLNAGLKPKGEIYGGWEAGGVSGHSLGHYLSACSMMYAASGDERFKQKTDYIISELDQCQRARKTGYVGGIPREDSIFNEVAAGDIRSQGFDLNGGWVPWYTIHKLLAGLLDAYDYTQNPKAKQILIKFADWIDVKFKDLSETQFQKMLDCEQGGMNEVLANIYAITGNKKYLALSFRFNHKKILDPLAEQEDILPGKHANTQIPKIIGAARQYELTGNEKEKRIASYFWEAVTNHHSYVIGGNSNFEHFNKIDELSNYLSDNTTETCNSYNMLKLTRHLFALHPSAGYMDYYERTLYNHILASINPENGMTCYYVPLAAGAIKKYATPTQSFWCCTGTGMENHVKYGESIYAKGTDGSLFVNLFIPSKLNWKERDMQITLQTNLPLSNVVTVKIEGNGKPAAFPVKIRYPKWAGNVIKATVNGKTETINCSPGEYLAINRTWKPGDVISITLPMHVYTEVMPDNENRLAFLYGPVVLSGALGNETLLKQDIPVLVSDENEAADLIELKSDEHSLLFTTTSTNKSEVSLIPFYQMHQQHYVVYWDKFSTNGWKEKKKEYEAEIKHREELAARTVDNVRIGEMQPERDHNMAGEKTSTGEAFGRKWRDANDGGWFSFQLETKGITSLELACSYWGSDGGNRVFDILIDDKKIASQELKNEKPNEFFDVFYKIPANLLEGKQEVTVTFRALPGSIAGVYLSAAF